MSKVWFCITKLCDWLTKLAPLSQPVGIQATRFPALGASYMYLLRILINSLCLHLLQLARVITLVLVLRHSIGNGSIILINFSMLGCCLHTSYGGLSRIQSLFSPSLSGQFIRRSRRDFLEANQTSREKIFALVTLTTFWGPCWVPFSYEMRSSQRAKKRCVHKETLKAGSHEQHKHKRKCKRKYKQTHV